MLIEVKQWPESQEVMENSDWFFLMAPRTDSDSDPIGDSAYGRVLDEDEYMLIKDIKEKYTFSEYVNLYSSDGQEHVESEVGLEKDIKNDLYGTEVYGESEVE